jgi:hypothetical protein
MASGDHSRRLHSRNVLKLYSVKVWRTSEPGNNQTVWVRTFTARRAQYLAIETYPGCTAHTLGVLLDGTWNCAGHDD